MTSKKLSKDIVVKQPVITLDMDWAPDFVLEYVYDILCHKKVRATWFVTHNTPFLEKLRNSNLFELGVHPNFLIKSTHGKDPDSILKYVKKIVPEAKSIRTHSLFQSSPLLLKFQKYGIENDVSLHLEKTPYLIPHYSRFLNLFRFPFFWGDGNEMTEPHPNWTMNNPSYNVKGLKIFYFHPIHIYLNSQDLKRYSYIKKNFDFSTMGERKLSKFINKEKQGVLTLFEEMTNMLKTKKTFTIMDLRQLYFTN